MTATALSPIVRQPFAGSVYQVAGHPSRCVMSAADSGGAYSLFEIDCPPGDSVPLHSHANEDETFIVLQGTITFQVDADIHIAPAGTVVFGPRNIPHRFSNETDQPARLYVMTNPGGFERFFAAVDAAVYGDEPFTPETYVRIIESHAMTVYA
jgi:quercetin dioxygenase-like cupin family protein